MGAMESSPKHFSSMERAGTVNYETPDFEWTIPGFTSLRHNEYGEYYSSPSFKFGGETWHLGINPDGYLRIVRESSGSPINLDICTSLKTTRGERIHEHRSHRIFREEGSYAMFHYIERSKLFKRRSEILPSDVLTVVCTLEKTERPETEDEWSSSSSDYGENESTPSSTGDENTEFKNGKRKKEKEKKRAVEQLLP